MMGGEATSHPKVGNEGGTLRVLLESTELILRGEIKRRFPRASIDEVRVDGDLLRIHAAGEAVTLHLGKKMAQSWAIAITKPPPSLRAKLGLDNGERALLVGEIADDTLAKAIKGLLVADGAAAQMMIAVIDDPANMVEAQRVHADFPTLPLWTVYPKGRGVDSAIRAVLREAGFRDTKSCAVSENLTAMHYRR